MIAFNVLVELFSKIAFDHGVTLGACFVNVNFPADATGVGAFAGDAMERIIKSGDAEKHRSLVTS